MKQLTMTCEFGNGGMAELLFNAASENHDALNTKEWWNLYIESDVEPKWYRAFVKDYRDDRAL